MDSHSEANEKSSDGLSQGNRGKTNSNKVKVRSYKCEHCGKLLSSKQNLREHKFTHTGELPYVCRFIGCGLRFRQGSVLSAHKKVHVLIDKFVKQEGITCLKLTDHFNNFIEELEIYNEISEESIIFLPKIEKSQEFYIDIHYGMSK